LNERFELFSYEAIRAGKAFGVSTETIMRMKNGWDIAQVLLCKDKTGVAP
jgi:plasmid maintenance system antidote protein VapI